MVYDLIKYKYYQEYITTNRKDRQGRVASRMERAVCAIDRVLDESPPITRKMMKMVYIDRTHSPVGAGLILGCSQSMSYAIINQALADIAQEMGYEIK